MLLSAILGCQAPSTLPPGGAIEPGWYTLPPLPHPLQEVAVLARDDGTAWVLGGFDDTIQVRQEIWILGTDRVWREGPALPEPLHHLNAALVDGDLVVLGALSGRSFTAMADAWRLPAGSEVWEALAPVPEAVGAAAVGVVDGRVVLAGGLAGPTVDASFRYTPATDAWEVLPALPGARDHGVGAGGDVFLALGGRQDGLGNVRDDVWALEGDTWTARTPMPTARAGSASATLPDGRVAILGGEGADVPGGVFADVEVYDPSNDTWEVWEPMPLPVHGTGAVWWGEGILVPGGADTQAFRAIADVQLLVPQ